MKINVLGVGAAVALAAMSASASNQSDWASSPVTGLRFTLPLDGSWTALDEFISVGGFFSGPWTYSSPVAVQLDVTDLYVITDANGVWVDGSPVGSTPILPDYFALGLDALGSAEPDPDLAWINPLFSKGSFILPAGTHDVTFQSLYIPTGFGDATVAFRATPVPAPAAAGLLGIASLAMTRRRR